MANRFPMYHAATTAAGETTQEAFDALWQPKGWRKSPPAAKPKRAHKATKKATAAPSEDSDTTS